MLIPRKGHLLLLHMMVVRTIDDLGALSCADSLVLLVVSLLCVCVCVCVRDHVIAAKHADS